MEIDTLLVPVDGTSTSDSALEHAVAIAERYDAHIHALYVLAPEESAATGEALMEDTRASVDRSSFTHSVIYGFSTEHLTHHPGSVVLDVAAEIDADFIVIPREDASETLGMAAGYVVQYASQPVLSV